MNKGLEIINLYENSNYLNTFHPNFMKDLQIVKKELQRLEAIDNAKPSEAFECLRQIGVIETYHRDDGTLLKDSIMFKPKYDTIKQALLKAQEQEKVLEIIKEKNVDIVYLKDSNNVEEYNSHFGAVVCKLTPEEYDAVKRWFK